MGKAKKVIQIIFAIITPILYWIIFFTSIELDAEAIEKIKEFWYLIILAVLVGCAIFGAIGYGLGTLFGILVEFIGDKIGNISLPRSSRSQILRPTKDNINFLKEAKKKYRKGVRRGDPSALRSLSEYYFDAGYIKKSFDLKSKANELERNNNKRKALQNNNEKNDRVVAEGDPKAINDLANKYNELGDYAKAFKLYLIAAQKGYVNAQYNVMVCYAHGKGCREDMEMARYWCKKAAYNGDPDCKRMLEQAEREARIENEAYEKQELERKRREEITKPIIKALNEIARQNEKDREEYNKQINELNDSLNKYNDLIKEKNEELWRANNKTDELIKILENQDK